MSLQWTFIATFLYVELVVVIFLWLPFIPATRWQTIFKSRMLHRITSYANLYFNVFILVLLVLFADAIREMRKYSGPLEDVDLKNHPNAEATLHMKLFRAQRNFYIAGFALFLWLVVRRLVTLISTQALLMAESEASRRQAESATEAAKRMLEEQENRKNAEGSGVDEVDDINMKLNECKKELMTAQDALAHAQLDLESMKKQAQATNVEYDRLMKELEETQKKLTAHEHESGDDKKDS